MLRVTRVAGRCAPRPELLVELRGDGGALSHEGVVLRAAALCDAAARGALAPLARALQAQSPALALAPEAALVDVLRVLAARAPPAMPAAPPPPPRAAPPAPWAAPPPPPPPPAAPLALLAGIGDLQRVGPSALQAAKAKMEAVFEAHRVAPGDAGFVYDKRAEFSPAVAASEWDE
jgi:hypothetical protein